MQDNAKISLDNIINEIKLTEERIKKAKNAKDKIGYEIALEKLEELYKKYDNILYKKREPTKVFEKKW